MATFLFSTASLSSVTASTIYYLQAVVTTPAASFSVIADIPDLLSTPQVLTGATYMTQVLSFPDQVFNTRTYVSTHVGFVLVERIGAVFASSDPLIAFIPYTNAFGQEIIQPVGTYAIPIDFAANGLFTGVNAWQYQVGSYIDTSTTYPENGLISLIGTKNNTSIFSNPCTGSSPFIETLANNGSDFNNLFGKAGGFSIGGFGNTAYTGMFRFSQNSEVSFNTNGQLRCTSVNPNAKIYGSNSLANGWVAAAILNSSNWTLLGTIGSTGITGLNTAGVFYKYFKIEQDNNYGDNNFILFDLEFYNCSIRTPKENFV